MSSEARAPGDRLVQAGVVVFVVGVLAGLAVFVPFLFGDGERPLWLSLGSLLMPVGLGLALLGLVRQARKGP